MEGSGFLRYWFLFFIRMDRLTVSVFKGSVGLVFGFGSGFGTRFLVSLGLDSVGFFQMGFGFLRIRLVFQDLDLVFSGSGFGFFRIGFGFGFLRIWIGFSGSGFFFGQVLGVYFVWDIFDALTIQRCFSSAPFQNLFD